MLFISAEHQRPAHPFRGPEQRFLDPGVNGDEVHQLLHGDIQHPIHHGEHAEHIQLCCVLIEYRGERLAKESSLKGLFRVPVRCRVRQVTGENHSDQLPKGIFTNCVQSRLNG